MSRWVQSWRDLPLMVNQWANVVRWEMRTRMFLRTSEFLWQEGHTAHADKADAMAETMRALEMYRAFAEGPLALPVVAGEKPENERFPGAVATYSIEAMMQDGKALAGRHIALSGHRFRRSVGHPLSGSSDGARSNLPTPLAGACRRGMIGGVIMTHGDDDGLRCPPQIAPHQIVIIPMLRDNEEDAGDPRLLPQLADSVIAARLGRFWRAAFARMLDAKVGQGVEQALGVGQKGCADHRRGWPARHVA